MKYDTPSILPARIPEGLFCAIAVAAWLTISLESFVPKIPEMAFYVCRVNTLKPQLLKQETVYLSKHTSDSIWDLIFDKA